MDIKIGFLLLCIKIHMLVIVLWDVSNNDAL